MKLLSSLKDWYRLTFTGYCAVCKRNHDKDGVRVEKCFVCGKRHRYNHWQYSDIIIDGKKRQVAICGRYATPGWTPSEKIKTRTLMPDGTVLTGQAGIRARAERLRRQNS